jgi:hypothetical protein
MDPQTNSTSQQQQREASCAMETRAESLHLQEQPSKTDESKDVLLEDMKCVYNFQICLTTLRHAVLGASLAAVSLIVTFAIARQHEPFATVAVQFTLLGISFATIRITGALNRAQYVFGAYVRRIQESLGGVGFWICWSRYLRICGHNDSITYAFASYVRYLNWFLLILVIGQNSWLLSTEQHEMSQALLLSTSIIFTLALTLWNQWYISKRVDSRGFSEKIDAAFDKATLGAGNGLPSILRHYRCN